MTALAGFIRDMRKRRGLGLREVARRAGISASYLTDLEAGRRNPGGSVTAALAVVLSVPLAELQALDPRLPAEAAEAFRLAMTGDAEGISEHLAGLSEEQLELIQTAARDLDAASCHELVRRHS